MHTRINIEQAIVYGQGNFTSEDIVDGEKRLRLFLVRCPECHAENYTPAVSSGICAWCGWPQSNINNKEIEKC